MKRLCVFAGSSAVAAPPHLAAARALGREVAARRIVLVYGGGRAGVMGDLADAALSAGGRAIGVIPDFMFEKGLAHPDLTELHVVGSMHDRMSLMAELSSAFLALPGGYGTMEELFEALTGAQLGLHRKPCGLLDVGGYFDPLLRFLDRARADRLLKEEHLALLQVGRRPGPLLDRLDRLAVDRKRRAPGPRSDRPLAGGKVTVYDRVYDVVRRVPRGRVVTYGQVAALAGIPNPRQVGYALHALREGEVPWHRVINARGEVSLRSEPGGGGPQRRLLEAEGVRFDERGRVSLERYGWRPGAASARRPGRGGSR